MRLYHSRSQTWNLDSARQSQIEGSKAPGLNEEHHSQIGKGDEEDRFDTVAASPNAPNLTSWDTLKGGLWLPQSVQ